VSSTLSGFSGITKIPELKKRLLFTVFMIAVYRIGVHVPAPGIDGSVLSEILNNFKGTLFGVFNMFSGGAFQRMSIFALGIMPYISSSIIFQLLTVVVPYLERLSKEGDAGRKKITQYTRYGTIVLSVIQGFGISTGLEAMKGPAGQAVVMNPGIAFKAMTVITLAAGTAFIMWLGEQINERGIGNGISLIICAGIVAGLPGGAMNSIELVRTGELAPLVMAALVVLMVVVVGCIIFMERGQRRIPVQYAKRIVGRKMMGGQSTHLPLKLNTSGVIPAIFASSLLMFPATMGTFMPNNIVFQTIQGFLMPGSLGYNIVFSALIVFFCFFYTAIVFNPVEVADNMKKSGGYIPGIRPGRNTSDYIDKVLSRITVGGAAYLSAVCVLPTILISYAKVPFYFGGTALLIAVGVGLDFVAQIQAHLLTRNYDGFMKKAKLRGRR